MYGVSSYGSTCKKNTSDVRKEDLNKVKHEVVNHFLAEGEMFKRNPTPLRGVHCIVFTSMVQYRMIFLKQRMARMFGE